LTSAFRKPDIIKPRPIVPRLRRRKAVTIVAGFFANSGVVLAADSQEIISEYAKTNIGKIRVLYNGDKWRVGMAGSSDQSPYLESFKEELGKELHKLETYDREKMIAITKAVLHQFHKRHIWPKKDRKSPFEALIALQCASPSDDPKTWQPTLFETHETTVTQVHGFRTVGIGTFMAEYLKEHFGGNGLDLTNASLDHLADLCVLILKEVKKAVAGCDGLTSVVLFYKDGRTRWMSTAEVRKVEIISDEFQALSTNVLMALTDPAFTEGEFSDLLDTLSKKEKEFQMKRAEFMAYRNRVISAQRKSQG
jgi:hypothetical protein